MRSLFSALLPIRASVIVPTHNRAATLDLAIESIQAQTIKDIEIIIAGDGVTPEVREVVRRLTAQDPRIRFLDYPKAPGHGYENRHRAVLACRSAHVFYSDDDDLWFPDHVERLGEALSHVDVADSAVLSVAPSSRLHRAFVTHSHPSLRRLLAAGKLKLIFDTHLAHSRALYDRLGNPWTRGVADMLSAFAASDAKWATLNKPTALSLHGAARRDATPRQRRDELTAWLARIRAGLPATVPDEATGVRYLGRVMEKVPPRADEGTWGYLARCGVAREGIADGGVATGATPIAPLMSADAAADMEAAFALHRGSAPDNARLDRILLPLAEPLFVRISKAGEVAQMLCRAMPPGKALHAARQIRPEHRYDNELQTLLRAELLMISRKVARARAVLRRENFLMYGPDAALMRARMAFHDGQPQEGLRILRKASERFPVRPVYFALAEALRKHGAKDEAKAVRQLMRQGPSGMAVATPLPNAIETDTRPTSDPEDQPIPPPSAPA